MKNSSLLILIACGLAINTIAQVPAAGPYYFVSDNLNGAPQFFWGPRTSFGNIKVIENMNLLAAVLGDLPPSSLPSGQQLVPREIFDFGGGTVELQPFAFTVTGNSKKFGLPAGTNLKRFLSDPLGGGRFDLSLPFMLSTVALSNSSALLRGGTDASVWHTALDLDVSGNSVQGFDIVAPADGIVEGNGGSTTLCLRHKASNGKDFLTIYSHIIPASKSFLTNGMTVKRGQLIGKVQEYDSVGNKAYTHLHFSVAVKGPSRLVNGTTVPELWYVLDPFGVYDYRRNMNSTTEYNYLPNNNISSSVKGIIHAYPFLTNPVSGSLLLPKDCVNFNPLNATVQPATSGFNIQDGSHVVFSFPNQEEANQAVNIIRQYKINQSCFLGRPDASMQYLLVNGLPPSGACKGEDCVSFTPTNISLKSQGDGSWLLVSGTQSLLSFPNIQEAGNALAIIRGYGFTKLCFVGRPQASLQYLRK